MRIDLDLERHRENGRTEALRPSPPFGDLDGRDLTHPRPFRDEVAQLPERHEEDERQPADRERFAEQRIPESR